MVFANHFMSTYLTIKCEKISAAFLIISVLFKLGQWSNFFVFSLAEASFHYADFVIDS